MTSDEIVGVFEEAYVGGLGPRDATITIDYEQDCVTLTLVAGEGNVLVEKIGQQVDPSDEVDNLWNSLTDGHEALAEPGARDQHR